VFFFATAAPAQYGARPAAPPSGPVAQPQPALPPATTVRPAAWQPPSQTKGPTDRDLRAPGERGGEFQPPVEPPGREVLFRLESESSLFERIRQEALERTPPDRVVFPDEPILSRDTYLGRAWPGRNLIVEPNYVCYNRLLFEDLNSERYGWDLGVAQPAVSTGLFFFDFLTLPYHLAVDPCRCYECNTGYCLPGDPVAYLIYPPNLSLTGAVAEVGTVFTMIAIFP
jgi:hypothetical protein